jgi:hypothetical protein
MKSSISFYVTIEGLRIPLLWRGGKNSMNF